MGIPQARIRTREGERSPSGAVIERRKDQREGRHAKISQRANRLHARTDKKEG